MTSFDKILPIGFGLMNFTIIPEKKFTQEEFNSTFKEILTNAGASQQHPLFINSGEFYGVPERHEGLKLLGGFFKAHPEYADSVVVSVKGGVDAHWAPDTSAANLDAAIKVTNEYLQPLYAARKLLPKTLDIFTVARVGEEPIEAVVKHLESHVKENHLVGICLSEIYASTLSRAVSAGKIAAAEIEFSLFHPDAIENGFFKIAAENNVAVIAYSPLGMGVLVGKSADQLTDGDFRNHLDKFSDPEATKHNAALVEHVKKVAEENNLTPAQLALSWIITVSGSSGNPQVVPIPGGTNSQRQLSNFQSQKLPQKVFDDLSTFLKSFKTAGYRYNKMLDQFLGK